MMPGLFFLSDLLNELIELQFLEFDKVARVRTSAPIGAWNCNSLLGNYDRLTTDQPTHTDRAIRKLLFQLSERRASQKEPAMRY